MWFNLHSNCERDTKLTFTGLSVINRCSSALRDQLLFSHLVLLRSYSWLCTQGSILAGSGNQICFWGLNLVRHVQVKCSIHCTIIPTPTAVCFKDKYSNNSCCHRALVLDFSFFERSVAWQQWVLWVFDGRWETAGLQLWSYKYC